MNLSRPVHSRAAFILDRQAELDWLEIGSHRDRCCVQLSERTRPSFPKGLLETWFASRLAWIQQVPKSAGSVQEAGAGRV
jgi:hypothetical protein